MFPSLDVSDFFTRTDINVILQYMTDRLNSNCMPLRVFLPFVSLWFITFGFISPTSAQEVDEFAAFEEEINAPAESTPPPAPAVVELAPQETSAQKIERLKKEIRKGGPAATKQIVQLANELYKAKQYKMVTLLLWKHVEKIDRTGLLLLAEAHEQLKEPDEMIRVLNIEIGKNDKDAEAYTLMGQAYLMKKKNNDAMEAFKKAIEINPKYESAYDGLIRMYEKRNPPNLYELRILYQDMIANIGKRPVYLTKLCEINTLDGTYEPAMNACRDAISKSPKVGDNYVYLGLAQKAVGDDKLAMATLKKAAQQFPKAEIAQYNFAKLLEEQKNYVEAMKVYKTGTEADPKSARSWLGLATTSFEIKKYEIALLAFKNACRYDKKNAVAFRRATTTLRTNRNSQWVDKFENASENCTF